MIKKGFSGLDENGSTTREEKISNYVRYYHGHLEYTDGEVKTTVKNAPIDFFFVITSPKMNELISFLLQCEGELSD